MTETIELGEIVVDVLKKNIKNIHLSVYPPTGRVRISAPERMSLDTIRIFAISKLSWIKHQQHKVESQEREAPRKYIDRESHYLWGKRYLLKVVETDSPPVVILQHRYIVLNVRPGSDETQKGALVAACYREQIRNTAPDLIAKWERLMGVKVEKYFVQHMKTMWGSCNPRSGYIRLNTELAKKPRECLEYIIVHEMAHLLEPTHNARFTAVMDQFMPGWHSYRDMLNRLPVRHERWEY